MLAPSSPIAGAEAGAPVAPAPPLPIVGSEAERLMRQLPLPQSWIKMIVFVVPEEIAGTYKKQPFTERGNVVKDANRVPELRQLVLGVSGARQKTLE